MPDYGHAIIATDLSFVPGDGALTQIEEALRRLEVIGGRVTADSPGGGTVKWVPGPKASQFIRGNPKEISVYVGEPTQFFDGTEIVSNTTFILETLDADPGELTKVLTGILGTTLVVHPFRI